MSPKKNLSLDEILHLAEESTKNLGSIDSLKEQVIKHIQDRDKNHDNVRAFVTIGMSALFILSVSLVVIFSLAENSASPICHTAIYETAELIERLVSPIMFLVLGFYFGTERKQG